MYCKALPDYPDYKPGELNDEALVKQIWNVLDKADIVIGQNSDAFDIKKLNARFLYYKLPAPSSYQSVDTLKAAKKWFRFESNSLDALSKYLEEGRKAETGGFNLWVKCIEGDKEAWNKMKHYNVHDVELLERLYLRLLPFIDTHPNLNTIIDNKELACSTCLSKNIQKRGYSYTALGKKQRYQCNDCKSWSTGKWERVG